MGIEHLDWDAMTVPERARHLLAIGVTANLDLDPEKMEPGYRAAVPGVGALPCGLHTDEQTAIEAGTAWLQQKAESPEGVDDGE